MVDNAIPLAQARENSTSAVSVHTPPTQHRDKVETIMLCNTSGSAATFRLFFDADGTTYDETTALYWDTALPADSTLTLAFDRGLYMANDSANIAYRSSVANAITISVWGVREFRNQ
jgi:hypothetical protein